MLTYVDILQIFSTLLYEFTDSFSTETIFEIFYILYSYLNILRIVPTFSDQSYVLPILLLFHLNYCLKTILKYFFYQTVVELYSILIKENNVRSKKKTKNL